jgi:DNA recombination protein RmuC
MQDVVIGVVGLVFLLAGLGIGLYLRQVGIAVARGQARQEIEAELVAAREQLRARDEQTAELRRAAESARSQETAAQARIMELSTDLAGVRTEASRLPELKKGITDADVLLQQAREELRRKSVEAASALTRATEMERQVGEQQVALAAAAKEAAARQAEVRSLGEARTQLATDLDAERRAAVERLEEVTRNREQVRAEVEKLAGRLLDEKGKAILDRNEVSLKNLLDPLSEKLKTFESKVERTYDQENRDRAQLLESLKTLQTTQARLHEDAEALSRALTGESRAQGDWGELVLERVLETAGLTQGREYALQMSHTDDEGGRKRPDALVYLPGSRVIVVDAKCSLTAFVEAARTTDPQAREVALDAHVASVRNHVKMLASKNYQDVVQGRTLDIVLLFVPNEAAFNAAITRAAGLYEEAFRQRIVICSPTTLLAALQLISHVWRSEKQNANAQAIAEEAGKMLEKLATFVEDLDGLGNRLEQAQASYTSAKNKLSTGRGNVMKKARDIAALGARVKSDKVEGLLLAPGVDDEAQDGDEQSAADPAGTSVPS